MTAFFFHKSQWTYDHEIAILDGDLKIQYNELYVLLIFLSENFEQICTQH